MIDKKEMKKQYKQHVPAMGIYQIRNLIDGKIFIIGARDLHGQMNSCRFQLKHGLHANKELQADYDRLGEEKFSFKVVDSLEPKKETGHDPATDLKTLEEMWLDKLQPYDDKGYHKRKKRETEKG
jgi:hypothetical protein